MTRSSDSAGCMPPHSTSNAIFPNHNDISHFSCGLCGLTRPIKSSAGRLPCCFRTCPPSLPAQEWLNSRIYAFTAYHICWSCGAGTKFTGINCLCDEEENILMSGYYDDLDYYYGPCECPDCGYGLDSAWVVKWSVEVWKAGSVEAKEGVRGWKRLAVERRGEGSGIREGDWDLVGDSVVTREVVERFGELEEGEIRGLRIVGQNCVM